jgi:hypothetical protein
MVPHSRSGCSSTSEDAIPPIIERNAAPKRHPGAEVPSVSPAEVGPSDAAVLRAIKGRGIVATIPSHFAVLVIGALAAAYLKAQSGGVPSDVVQDIHRCVDSVNSLRVDLTVLKAEVEQHNAQTEHDINQLLIHVPPK